MLVLFPLKLFRLYVLYERTLLGLACHYGSFRVRWMKLTHKLFSMVVFSFGIWSPLSVLKSSIWQSHVKLGGKSWRKHIPHIYTSKTFMTESSSSRSYSNWHNISQSNKKEVNSPVYVLDWHSINHPTMSLAFDDLIDVVANKATSSAQNVSHERNQKFISSLSVTLLLCFFFILRSSASPFLNPLVSAAILVFFPFCCSDEWYCNHETYSSSLLSLSLDTKSRKYIYLF